MLASAVANVWTAICAETSIFGLMRFVDSSPVDEELDIDSISQRLLPLLQAYYEIVFKEGQADASDRYPRWPAVGMLRTEIIDNSSASLCRAVRLMRLARQEARDSIPLDISVVRRVVESVIKLPAALDQGDPTTKQMLRNHYEVLRKLQSRNGEKDSAPAGMESLESETCEICSNRILLEALRWARCSKNHEYSTLQQF